MNRKGLDVYLKIIKVQLLSAKILSTARDQSILISVTILSVIQLERAKLKSSIVLPKIWLMMSWRNQWPSSKFKNSRSIFLEVKLTFYSLYLFLKQLVIMLTMLTVSIMRVSGRVKMYSQDIIVLIYCIKIIIIYHIAYTHIYIIFTSPLDPYYLCRN